MTFSKKLSNMKKEDFEELLESVKEAGQILRGEIQPSREFLVKVPNEKTKKEGFAVCVKTDDDGLLIPFKIYPAKISSTGHFGVIDEEGEAAVYPPDYFARIEISPEIALLINQKAVEFA